MGFALHAATPAAEQESSASWEGQGFYSKVLGGFFIIWRMGRL